MVIFEFDVQERLDDIKRHFQQVLEIKNSLADNRQKYRNLSNEINISQYSLFQCCDAFERSLLINCYTFSEQLMKNFIYEAIDKDRHENKFLNKFIDNKIHKSRFSPNVKFNRMEEDIKKDLLKDFKFILPKSLNEIKIYDEMVNSRHTYAHRGVYNFDFENFSAVIKVIEYIYFEFSTIINYDENFRVKFQHDFKEVSSLSKKISKINEIKYEREKLKEIKKMCKSIVKNYSSKIESIELFKELYENIKNVSKMDLRDAKRAQSKVTELSNML